MSEGNTKVVLVQLGSPKSPSKKDVRSYLKQFLADPRVVDINPWIWKIILNLFILPFRPKRSAKLYSRIWDGESFPLITNTENFSLKVQQKLQNSNIEVDHAFLLSKPSIANVLDSWQNDINPATHLKVVSMFPQYSEATTASAIDALSHELSKRVNIPQLSVVTNFHTSRAFIDSSVAMINQSLNLWIQKGIQLDCFLLTFHGIPKRRVSQKLDVYYRHCFETFYLIRKFVQQTHPNLEIKMSFQSRFGSEEWLTPYTEETVIELISSGKKNIAIYSPSFVVDCLETLDELAHELKETAHEHGGDIFYIPCLNDSEQWCEDFSKWLKHQVHGSSQDRKEDYYKLEKDSFLANKNKFEKLF